MSLETLRSHLEDLNSLKSLSKCLRLLVDNLDAVIETRREALLPASRHVGLASLPNEVLLHIFRQFILLHKDVFDGARMLIRDISLVSKQFREMVLAFTEVWAYLDLAKLKEVEVLDMLISRAKNAPLSVRFEYYLSRDKVLLRALEFHNRWRHIYATFVFPVSIAFQDDDCWSVASPRSFPAARTLEIIPSKSDIRAEGCPRWAFPQLEILEIAGGIPKPNGICCESLKQVQFVFSGDDEFAEITELTDFLRRIKYACYDDTCVLMPPA